MKLKLICELCIINGYYSSVIRIQYFYNDYMKCSGRTRICNAKGSIFANISHAKYDTNDYIQILYYNMNQSMVSKDFTKRGEIIK